MTPTNAPSRQLNPDPVPQTITHNSPRYPNRESSTSSSRVAVADCPSSDWQSTSGEDNDEEYSPSSGRRTKRQKRRHQKPEFSPPQPIQQRHQAWANYVRGLAVNIKREVRSDESDTATLQLYLCSHAKCPKSFTTEKNLKKHAELHKQVHKSKCDLCKRKYFSRGTSKPQLCLSCQQEEKQKKLKSAEEEKEAEDFRSSSWLVLPVDCFICATSFVTEADLKAHLRQEHGSEQVAHICKVCLYVADHPLEFYAHSRAHDFDRDRPLRCIHVEDNCIQQFRNAEDMGKHIQTDHNVTFDTTTEVDPLVDPLIVIETPERKPSLSVPKKPKLELEAPFPTIVVATTVESPDVIKEETKSQLGDLAKPDISENGTLYPCPPYLCYICLLSSCRSEDELVHHLQDHRRDERKKVCNYCNFETNDIIKFHVHSREHEKQFPFCCPVCYEKTRTIQSLEIHMSVIHGVTKKVPNPEPEEVKSPPPVVKKVIIVRSDMPEW